MLCLLCLCLCFVLAFGDKTYAHITVVRDENGTSYNIRVSSQPLSLDNLVDLGAHGWYEAQTLNTTGWSQLKVSISEESSLPQEEKAYAAGYLEGYLTWLQIYQMAINLWGGQAPYYPALTQFLRENEGYVHAQVAQHKDDPFWVQTGLLYRQFDGLYDGYFKAATEADHTKVLSKEVIYAINIMGDLDDLCPAFGCDDVTTECSSKQACDRVNAKFRHLHRLKNQNVTYPVARKGDEHCSILIKPLGDINNPSDILFGHNTWASYGSMGPRILKLYDFPYLVTSKSTSRVPGKKIEFSSYPGTLYSNDDWYTISSGLTVSETTISNNNATLYKSVVPECVLIWARTMVANRLANSGKSWTDLIARENSGTYNNAWHILDWKTWGGPKTPIPKRDFFWQVELMPGYAFPIDLSQVLKNQGYWASYNRIYNKFLFNLTMQPVAEFGDHFSHDKTARAQIFHREHHTVTDIESFRKLMRFNKFQTDPLGTQGCKNGARSGSNAISERGDLSSPTDCIDDVVQQDEAGIDLKFTSGVSLKESRAQDNPYLRFFAIAGPTNDDQPIFVWSKSPFAHLAHLGQVDKWNFPLVDCDTLW